jgi:hypothetical protein
MDSRQNKVLVLAEYEAKKQEAISNCYIPTPEQLLAEKTKQICISEGISYVGLKPVQRLFLTHYRCPKCKLLPLYLLDLHPKRARCRSCGHPVTFKNSGKYGKMRKKIAFLMLREKLAPVQRQ